MIHVDAKVSLLGYRVWRESLEPLPIGTIIEWNIPYAASTIPDSIKPSQMFKITKVRRPLMSKSAISGDQVYDMVLVNSKGKEFKRTTAWSVESIARGIHKEELTMKAPQ